LAFHRGVVASIVAADAERARYWMKALVTGAARDIKAVFHPRDTDPDLRGRPEEGRSTVTDQ
jgi:hypothetical protein